MYPPTRHTLLSVKAKCKAFRVDAMKGFRGNKGVVPLVHKLDTRCRRLHGQSAHTILLTVKII